MDQHEPASGTRSRPPPGPSPRIVVVGPCASGKSTLVAALQALGYDAHVSAQEHSAVRSLWRHTQPDVVIALAADIAAVRARRGDDWPEWLHDLQVQRLQGAAAAADLSIDTTNLDPESVSSRVLDYLVARAKDGAASRFQARHFSPRCAGSRVIPSEARSLGPGGGDLDAEIPPASE